MSEPFPGQESEPVQPEGAAAERPHAPEIKQPGTASRLSYSLFSSETRAGRFMRSLGRWLLTIILLVGAGMLVAYLIFLRPLDERMRSMQASLAASEQERFTAQKDRDTAVEQRKQADTRAKEAQEQLTTALTRVRILRGMNALKNAQLSSMEKNGTAAENAVDTAENILKQLYTQLDRLDPTYSSSVEARFTLVRNALKRDPASAVKEIETLVGELSRMENELK